MFDSMWKDAKYQVQMGNMVTRLVIVNVAVFIAIKLVWLLIVIFTGGQAAAEPYYQAFFSWLAISSNPIFTATHIWVTVTYMFVHEGFLHILFNMLYLYWFGNILGDMIGDKKILPLYLMGGLMGGLVYFIAAQYMTSLGGQMIGASAAGLAIVMASAMVAPEYNMRLLFLGDVKLKWIAAALILLDVFALSFTDDNTGGHISHLGGVLMGYLFITSLNAGKDLSVPVNNFFDKVKSFFGPKKLKVAYKNTDRPTLKRNQRAHAVSDEKESEQDQLDAILDKIKLKGYNSLSSSEKKFLADASKK